MFDVVGLISDWWRARDGAQGPFGNPVGSERDAGGGSRIQTFVGGEIAWSKPQEMVVSVHRMRNEACFEWDLTPDSGYHYDFFRHTVTYQRDADSAPVDQGQSNVEVRGLRRIWSRMQGFGTYGFSVQGCDDGGDCRQGWTVPVHAQLGPAAELPEPADSIAVGGTIGERWHELGAWSGPLGKALATEVFNSANGVHSQRFERGSVTTAPEFGTTMAVAAYQRGRMIEVNWGGANRSFNAFRVDIYFDGKKYREQLVIPSPFELARSDAGGGQLRVPAEHGNGLYWFFVYPTITLDAHAVLAPTTEADVTVSPVATNPSDWEHILDFRFGGTPQAHLIYDYGAADAFIPVSAVDSSAEHAFVSHEARATAVARHYANSRPLFTGVQQTGENITFQLLAHLHMVRRAPEFRARGELPSRWLVPSALWGLTQGTMGTKGEYDTVLKGLMTVVYRYRDLLSDSDIDWVLRGLMPLQLVGPWKVFDMAMEMTYNWGPFTGPETENHLLCMETTRYLANQMLYERTGDAKYSDAPGGPDIITARDWLLNRLHLIAKHDFQEFNARPYQRYSIHSILNLYEFAKDEAIRTAAQIVLDYATVKFALSSDRRRRVGPYRRLHRVSPRVGDTEYPDLKELLLNTHGDPHTGFGLMYAGPADGGESGHWFTDVWTAEALLAGLSSYRPPATAYLLHRPNDLPPYQHRFHHGQRPALSGFPAPEAPDPGVEIYYRSPSFLLASGGMFLNSGNGHDEFTSYDHVVYALPTWLVPTRADPTVGDLISFDPWPNNRDGRNNGVHTNFACGMNLRIPDALRPLGEPNGNWLFLNLNGEPAGDGLHFHVAAYRQPAGGFEIPLIAGAPLDNIGFLYAEEASEMSFAAFRDTILDRNQHLTGPLELGGKYEFHTPQTVERRITFVLNPFVDRYAATVTAVDGQPLAPDFKSLPLAEGPYLNSVGQGHSAKTEIRIPRRGDDVLSRCNPLILDFSDPNHPTRTAQPCPRWLIDTSRAYAGWAQALAQVATGPDTARDALDARLAGIKTTRTLIDVLAALLAATPEIADYETEMQAARERLVQLLIDAGMGLWIAPNRVEAFQLYDESLKTLRTLIGQPGGLQSYGARFVAVLHWPIKEHLGQDALYFPQLRDYSEEALGYARQLGDQPLLAETLIDAGVAEWQLPDHPTGAAHYREALTILRELINQGGLRPFGQTFVNWVNWPIKDHLAQDPLYRPELAEFQDEAAAIQQRLAAA
ncbi:hypothetical protein PV458_09500 [Streptomyces sp. MN03-5084-2B]|nr:hypothetical protein [Streptomyces sp. MN03-5084-2B]